MHQVYPGVPQRCGQSKVQFDTVGDAVEGRTGKGGGEAHVKAVRRVEEAAMVNIGLCCNGKEREDSATVIVDHHNRQVDSEAPACHEACQIVEQGQVACEEDRWGVGSCSYAQCRGDLPVDAVGAPVGIDGQRPLIDRHEGIQVPYRHRVGHNQVCSTRQCLAEGDNYTGFIERGIGDQAGHGRSRSHLGIDPTVGPSGPVLLPSGRDEGGSQLDGIACNPVGDGEGWIREPASLVDCDDVLHPAPLEPEPVGTARWQSTQLQDNVGLVAVGQAGCKEVIATGQYRSVGGVRPPAKP